MSECGHAAESESLDFRALAERFDGPRVRALALMGSFARGDAGPYSDVDLVRFFEADTPVPDGETHIIAGRLVTVGSVGPAKVERWFTEPEAAVNAIGGLRTARVLIDRQETFARIQARALRFAWDEAMQAKADAWVSEQMVGWIEEVHKGLEGLRQDDVGRMLNARFGCSWGLARVMIVHRGVLLSGDNGFYDEVRAAVGPETAWSRACAGAFGVGAALTVRDQVRAGLRLYVLTARMVDAALRKDDRPLVMHTVALIEAALGSEGEDVVG